MAHSENGPLINRYRELARQYQVWLSLGGFHELVGRFGMCLDISIICGCVQNEDGTNHSRPYNCHLLLNADGETAAKYRKLHLFNVDIPGKVRLMESEFSTAGDRTIAPVPTPIGRLGLATVSMKITLCTGPISLLLQCYDMRFPELAWWLRTKGATVLSYPSAFTQETGLAHWKVCSYNVCTYRQYDN